MLYWAIGSALLAVLVFVLGLAGVVRGAGMVSNAALFLSVVFLAGAAISTLRDRHAER